MISLYENKMAEIYDAMYQTFIDYDKEYEFYNTLIQKYNRKTILEIGSGTGNLALRFCNNNQNYTGMDFSRNMISISQKRNEDCPFIHGDMRDFYLENKVEAIIITGRSTSYLISNNDLNDTFGCLYKNITDEGIIIFDFIDANRFIPFINKHEVITHSAEYQGILYTRDSYWDVTMHDNFILEWNAKYYEFNKNEKTIISNDHQTSRVFTLNEIQIFLYLNNFEIMETIDRKTYAYDSYVIVAKKKS